MNGIQLLNRFELHNNPAVNKQVKAMFPDDCVAITDVNYLLTLEWDSLCSELERKCLFIYRFQETGPKRPMHADGRLYNSTR